MPRRLDRQRLDELLDSVRGRRVLIVGDVMLDRYIWGRVRRISPEAPVPVVEVVEENLRLGGAANVARTITVLGGEPLLLGVVGDDASAESLRKLLNENGIADTHLVVDGARPTSMKTRIMAEKQQVCRVDREEKTSLSDSVAKNLIEQGEALLGDNNAEALLFSDYGKGVLSEVIIHRLVKKAGGLPSCVDPKEDHFPAYAGVTVATPNHHEAARAVQMSDDYAGLDSVAQSLLQLTGCQNLLITCGARGMRLYEGKEQAPAVIETVAREVFDVTGAGDTVSGVLTLALAAGAKLLEASLLANLAAGVVVGKIGAATATPTEIKERYRQLTD